MPTDKELMQQALDALEAWNARGRLRIIEALRARLAQPESAWAPNGGVSKINYKAPEDV